MSIRVNIGCGQSPTPGWHNYDNSWSLRLARKPLITTILRNLRLLKKAQLDFIKFAAIQDIRWADATVYIPEANDSVDVVYSSHMLEHLDQEEAFAFLAEARRILKSGGIIRIAVPDLKYHIENYIANGDADSFIESTHLTRKKPKTFIEKIMYLVTGDRNHQWMYDGDSLCRLLLRVGFEQTCIMVPGDTRIPDPEKLNLMERVPESVFVEAINP